MHAVIRTGGKQYRVTAGDILEVEKLDGNVGDSIALNDVLLVSNGDMVKIGQPTVEGASVRARITGQHRGKKILVFRYRPKKRIRVRRGHRQYLTRIEIDGVTVDGVAYDSQPVADLVEDQAVIEDSVAEESIAEEVKASVEETTSEEAAATKEEAVEAASEAEEATVEETGVEETSVDEATEEKTASKEVAEDANDDTGEESS